MKEWIKPLGVFLGFLILFSGLINFFMIRHGFPPAFGRVNMWTPGFAAFATFLLFKKKISQMGWGWGATRFQVQGYLIPLGYIFISYLIIWGFGWGHFYDQGYVDQIRGWYNLPNAPVVVVFLIFFLVEATTGLFFSIATALGEEIGWRGFLVPHLRKRFSFVLISLISGLIWAVWHYPLWFAPYFSSGIEDFGFKILFFTLTVVFMSFPMAYLRLRSNSLWTGVVFHASHNLFLQTFFDPLTVAKPEFPLVAGEAGIILPLVTGGVAVYFILKGRKEKL